MIRSDLRMRVADNGVLEIVDPGLDCLDLLKQIDERFSVRSAPLEGFRRPRFLPTRERGCGLMRTELSVVDEGTLWTAHRQARHEGPPSETEATGLDLKIELAGRLLQGCRLCARRCRVDRRAGQRGFCGLGVEAFLAEAFVHIAEEAPVNPSLVLNLTGCGMRCAYCQQGRLIEDPRSLGIELDPSLWSRLDMRGARSISFVGGNPDESLYAILRFLAGAPASLDLPLVWNSHAYSTPEVLELLDGVVDAWLPDLKYGLDGCARRWSSSPGYVEAARAAIASMAAQGVPVIARILVLPGHVECCHLPSLRYLASLGQMNLSVSVRGQYAPDHHITDRDGAMAGRPLDEELARVMDEANALCLSLIDLEHKRGTH